MNDYENRIKEKGLKNTLQREAVYNVISEKDGPISAEEIYQELLKKKEKINLSTVYRTLETLSLNNIINKITFDNEQKCFYDVTRVEHRHYLICLGCKKIIPLDYCPFEGIENEVFNKVGFKVTGHSFEIYGYCKDCIKKLTI